MTIRVLPGFHNRFIKHSVSKGGLEMSTKITYQVILLPQREVAARGCSLAEANAWMQAYNHVLNGGPPVAVIAEEAKEESPAFTLPRVA